MFDFPRMRSFLEVADCLNFTEAAERLFTTQSALSKNIAKLEVELGFKLFERNNREVVLTKEGAMLRRDIDGNLKDMDDSIARARRVSMGIEGSFSLGMAGAVGFTDSMCSLLRGFSQVDARYDFDLRTMNFQEMRENIIRGGVDAVITKSFEALHLSECGSLCLMQSPSVLVVRDGHPLFKTLPNPSLKDFSHIGFIGIAPSFSLPMYNRMLACCRNAGFKPNVVRYTNTVYDLLIHIAISDYVGILDTSDVPLRDNLYHCVPLLSDQPVGTTLVWQKENRNPALNSFLRYVKEITADNN